MKKFVFIALLVLPVVAGAVTVVPVFSRNSDIDGTAEQISSSGGTACKKLTICNFTETAGKNVWVQNSASATTTTGYKLYPLAATAAGTNCITVDAGTTRGKNESDTIDATTWYAVSPPTNVDVRMICIP